MNKSTISISGGGIAGLATAIALKNIGVECSIFEASNQMLPLGAGLGLGINAMMAFRELGIYENIIRAGKALQSFTVIDQSGKPISKTSSFSISNTFAAGVPGFKLESRTIIPS